jgi:hypothetical protein
MKNKDVIKVSAVKKMTIDEIDSKKSDRDVIFRSILQLKKGEGRSFKKQNMDRLIKNIRTYMVQIKLKNKREKRDFITRCEFDSKRNPTSILVYRTN